MTALLIGASIPHEPLVRPLAMPAAIFLLQLGLQLAATGAASALGRPRAPFAISSVAKGAAVPPLALTLAEDVVAVDGGGGKAWRRELMARYDASPRFRQMVSQVNWLWAAGTIAAAAATLTAVWAVDDQTIAYGVG